LHSCPYTFPYAGKGFKYYIDHHSDVLKEYNGKFIFIKGDQVMGIMHPMQKPTIKPPKQKNWVLS